MIFCCFFFFRCFFVFSTKQRLVIWMNNTSQSMIEGAKHVGKTVGKQAFLEYHTPSTQLFWLCIFMLLHIQKSIILDKPWMSFVIWSLLTTRLEFLVHNRRSKCCLEDLQANLKHSSILFPCDLRGKGTCNLVLTKSIFVLVAELHSLVYLASLHITICPENLYLNTRDWDVSKEQYIQKGVL